MKTKFKIILTGTLLLAVTSVMAGIIFVPVGNRYTNLELAQVEIQNVGDGMVRVLTTGLTGEMSLDASDVPPEFEVPGSGCARFPFEQNLELVINPLLGVVEGHTSGRIATQNGTLEYGGDVRGNATCIPSGEHSCDQLIVDLEMRLVLADVSDPVRPGLIRMETLGSLQRGPDVARWASLTSNAHLGGDTGLISSLISMEEGESCGI